MKLLQIKKSITDGQNLIFYKQDVQDCYDLLKNEYESVFLYKAHPMDIALRDILGTIAMDKYKSLKYKLIAELKQLLIIEMSIWRLVIFFNFEPEIVLIKWIKMQILCVCVKFFEGVVCKSERSVLLSCFLLLLLLTYFFYLLTYLILTLNCINVASISCRLHQCCINAMIGGQR